MIPTDLDERLKRLIEGGGSAPLPAPEEGLDLEGIRALGQSMTESGGEDFPAGTQVNFAQPELEVAAPPPSRVPIQPKVVSVPTSAQQSPDAVDAAYARAADRQARQAMAMERGGRELVAGLTRTQVQPVTERPTNAFERYAAAKRQKEQDALRQTEAGNNAARTKAYLDTTAAAGPRAERGLDLKEAELKTREDLSRAKAAEDAAKFEETKRHNKQTEGIGWTGAKRADEKADRDDTRLALKTDALKPRAGWEPIEAGAPTFRDAAQAKTFDDSVAAMGAIRNHRDHVLHEVEALKNAKTPAEADTIAGRLNAQMGALASKLRAAEGLNNTDASNQAVENMLSLSHGSAINWKNLMNQGRLPSILNAAIASGEANLDTMAESNNLRRSKGGKGASAQPGGPISMKFPDGSVHEVPPEKVELAKRKGAVPNG